MKDISVVIPVFNEEEVFPELYKRVEATLVSMHCSYEIIFVDDGSSDKTRALIEASAKRNQNIKSLFFSRNFGHQPAVFAGLSKASGEVVVVMDGDLQDPPECIPVFYKKHKEGFDVVYAVRTKRKEGILLRFAYSLYYRILKKWSKGITLPLDAGDFCLMTKRVRDVICSMPESNPYIRGLRAWAGFRQIGMEYERDARFAGESKYSFWKLCKLAYDGFFSFSNLPLTLVTFFGFFCFGISVLGIVGVILVRLFTTDYPTGFASVAVLVVFIGGIQLLSIGIIGEYIHRIFEETKKRNLFIVDREIGF